VNGVVEPISLGLQISVAASRQTAAESGKSIEGKQISLQFPHFPAINLPASNPVQ